MAFYGEKTNRVLLEREIMKTPLSVAEIYSITDIRVVDGAGLCIEQMNLVA